MEVLGQKSPPFELYPPPNLRGTVWHRTVFLPARCSRMRALTMARTPQINKNIFTSFLYFISCQASDIPCSDDSRIEKIRDPHLNSLLTVFAYFTNLPVLKHVLHPAFSSLRKRVSLTWYPIVA